MAAAPDLTIVIVTCNSGHVLARCLDSIGPLLAERVLVVDNASSDGTSDLLRERRIRTLSNDANHGFGQAANAGAFASSAGWLCFLNPDCEASPDVFEHGCRALAGSPHNCAAPSLVENDGDISGRQLGYTRRKLVDDVLRSNYAAPRASRLLAGRAGYHDDTWSWPHGACFFIERDRFLDLGGFDRRYFMYMEDVDFGARLSAAGGTVIPLDDRVRHSGRGGARIDTRRRLALQNASRVTFARQHFGRQFALLVASLAVPSTSVRALRAGVRSWTRRAH